MKYVVESKRLDQKFILYINPSSSFGPKCLKYLEGDKRIKNIPFYNINIKDLIDWLDLEIVERLDSDAKVNYPAFRDFLLESALKYLLNKVKDQTLRKEDLK